jgi:hypothetical protein
MNAVPSSRKPWTLLGISLLLGACGAPATSPSTGENPAGSGATYVPKTGTGFPAGGTSAIGTGVGAAGHVAVTPPVLVGPAAGSAPIAAGGTSGGAVVSATGALPCAVDSAVQTGCQGCHGATQMFGAPMPLVTFADFQKPAVSDKTQTVAQIALKRVTATSNPMPPVGHELSSDNKATLVTWLTAGAQSAPATQGVCAPPSATGAADGTTHDVAYFKAGLTPLPGETCYSLPTHNGQTAGDTSPYQVSTGEHYENFYFNVPWKAGEVMTRFGTKFDNLQVIHHWLLFTSSSANSKVGSHETTSGTTLGDDSQMLAGWAVGGDNVTFPPDVALQLETTQGLNVQWHFNNPGAATMDSSAVQVCTVPMAMRSHIGSLTFLGTENFNGPIGMPAMTTSDFSGTCMNSSGAPITIFAFTPHMHKLGVHMKATVQHAAGMMETIFDKPFDFNSQITYVQQAPIVLMPGDSITSTCTFDNTTPASVPFGPSTTQEMCYMFTMAYPAQALDDGVLSLIGATNTCW